VLVRDEGPGIPEHAREQALRPFVRLEGAERQPGKGLGLAIAAAVARLHRGKLLLEGAEPGLRVRLQLEVHALGRSGAEVMVRDEGPGIPAHAREQALRPFVRLEGSTRQPGAGLGLAIAAAVARLHRGRLLLEGAEPGLRVRLQLNPG
ncbi:MAG: ATP-binding protein, partial [Gammaproteobacteria bacterium]